MILSEEKRDVLKADADALFKEVEALKMKLQFEECLQKLQVLINDYELLKDYRSLLKCHITSALCHYNLGNLKVAFELTNQYEHLCQQYQLPIVPTDYFPLLGLQYMYKGNSEKAIKYYNLAGEDALNHKLYTKFISVKKHVAIVASQLLEFDVALEALKEAKSYLSYMSEDDINHIELYLVEANIYLDMGDLERVKILLNYVKTHPMLGLYPVTHSLYNEYYAKYFFKANEYEQAYDSAIKGLELLKGMDQYFSEEDLYVLLIDICKALNDKDLLVQVYEGYIGNLKESREKSFHSELTKRDYEDMRKLTEIDNLTGIYNRKYLIEQTSLWLNNAPMNNDAIICCVFDIDYFKTINDTYGHLTGDEILKQLSTYCVDLIDKETMFLARYGGDEFVIIHRTSDVEIGLNAIRSIYMGINKFEVEYNMQVFNLSISMGISHSGQGEYLPFEDLFAEADEALYRSKESGRKQLTLF